MADNPTLPAQAQLVRQTLRHICELLAPDIIESGIPVKDVEMIVRTTVVRYIRKHYGIRKRPTNISRIAIMAGITRKSAKEIVDTPAARTRVPLEHNASVLYRVLEMWRSQSEYLDDYGEPRVLQWEGEYSLRSLIVAASADIPPTALRYELRRQGFIVRDDSNEWRYTGAVEPPNAREALTNLEDTLSRIIHGSAANDESF